MSENDDKSKLKVYPYDTRLTPIAPPSVGVFDSPTRALCINTEWLSHIDGLLDRLLWRDAWEGTDEQIDNAIQQVRLLLAFNQCDCGGGMDCCNELIAELNGVRGALARQQNQYRIENQTTIENNAITVVGSNYNGAGTPPLCTAVNLYVRTKMLEALNLKRAVGGLARFAQIVLGDVLANAFDGILGGTVFALSYANATAYESAFNDAVNLDSVVCNLRDAIAPTAISQNNFTNAINGLVVGTGNRQIIVETLQGGASDTLNYLYFLDCLTRTVPLANAGITACVCLDTWAKTFDFTLANGSPYWSADNVISLPNNYVENNVWALSTGWGNGRVYDGNRQREIAGIKASFDARFITEFEVTYTLVAGSGGDMNQTSIGGSTVLGATTTTTPSVIPIEAIAGTFTRIVSINRNADQLKLRVVGYQRPGNNNPNGSTRITQIIVRGVGVDPFI